MSLNFSIANVVYVKNLSSDITEENIREKFGSCDEIINITFKNFPGLNQKYCQIEFKTSEGITNASRLNGETLLNVPMVVSVIEPIIHNTNLNEVSTTESDKNVNSLLDVRNSITSQGVQTLLLQQQAISEQKKRLVDFQNSLNEKNNKFDVFSKIVYMENIPEKYDEEDIREFFQNIGNTTSYKLQYNEQKKVHTAFVEFKNEEHAKAALNLSGTKVGLHEICIRDAYSLINDKDNLKNNFSFYSNNTTGDNSNNNIMNSNTIMSTTNNLPIINTMNNINNINNNKFLLTTNPNVNEKVEKVLALKEKLAMKLCAMYNPNLLLVNNLVQPTNSYLLNVNNSENTNMQQFNIETTSSIQEEKLNDIKNDKYDKYEKDKKKKKKKDSSIDKSSYDRHDGETKKKSHNIKIKKYKSSRSSKYSNSSYSQEKSSSRNYSRSSTSSNKYKRNTISYTTREKKYIYDKIKKRKRSYNYSKSNSSYSDSNSNSRNSYDSDYHRYKNSYRHRKISKRKHNHKYTTSSSRSNSSYSERSRRRRRDSEDTKPWWVKESEKMKIRQKIKEQKMREMAIREKRRR
ncbi:putative RNA-binding protein [Plasmodium gaboni]|uniref:Negative elongation factor E n=1 Tax=Plasmodium gaboni TaxID=647221 RepID=A0A151LRD7_9APIC|nr:putative RNA-binding protein [Plasmodium gaboni]KYO01755.1 putative RNA-binding protein [Plasmodium gaboni]